MITTGKKNKSLLLILAGLSFLGALPLQAGTLIFSKPQRLVTLAWSDGSNHGVPLTGVEWLLVDERGGFVLESSLDFDLYTPQGKHLQTLNPVDKSNNFYGFAGMEPLPAGGLLLLQRLESPLEQRNKDTLRKNPDRVPVFWFWIKKERPEPTRNWWIHASPIQAITLKTVSFTASMTTVAMKRWIRLIPTRIPTRLLAISPPSPIAWKNGWST
jgi:hypothetical protein